MAKIRFLLYVLDYLGTLLAFVLVFFGLWILLLTDPIRGALLTGFGVALGIASFVISKRLKRNPQTGQERL